MGVHMTTIHALAFALCSLLSVGLFSPAMGKDPYLDFTCVASQALIPTASNARDVSITAYSPLSDATYTLGGESGGTSQPGRVGNFTCVLETEDYEAETTVIVSTEDAILYPPRLTVTYDPEEEIILQMTQRNPGSCSEDVNYMYRWLEVGSDDRISDTQELIFDRAKTSGSSIVLRNFVKGCKSRRGFVQLLFRECPTGKWSPENNCRLDCSICLNGGMCHPRTGQCICPPGFSGPECQNVHGRNVFGQLGQYSCSESADAHDDSCRGQLFCLVEPFGCTCAAGYKGISCLEECEEGKYGANCEQVCHCQDNSTCLADTGKCDGSPCQIGWHGPNCQDNRLVVTLEFDEVNINQTTNITCSVKYKTPLNETDFVLYHPDGTIVEADDTIEYENPVEMDYIFVVVTDSKFAVYTCSDVYLTVDRSITVTAHEPPQLSSPPTVFNSTSSTVTLTWEPWNNQTSDSGEGPLDKYIITYRELHADGVTGDTVTAGEVPGDTTLFVVQDLMEETEYEFRVAAARPGLGGAGAPSPPVVGNTTCAVPGLPTNVRVWPLNTTSLQLAWASPADTSCSTITYHISYWLKKQGKCSKITEPNIKEISTRRQSLVIGGLLPYSVYRVRVRSETEAGSSGESETKRSTTEESVPGPPTVMLNESTSTTLWFKWKELDCQDRNGVIRGYHYQLLDRDGDVLEEGVTSSQEDGKDFETLEPCTEYHFRVRGWTSAGNGSFSEAIAATTQTGVPDRITGLQILAINSTQLQVDWLPPNSTPCQIISYTVSYSLVQQGQCDPPEQAETMEVTSPDTMVNLTGLLPDSEYAVEVRAETAAGEGEGLNGTSRTLEELPGRPVVMLSENTSTTLQFKWTAPDCQDRNGDILGYHYQLLDSDGDVLEEGITSSQEDGKGLENLEPCTKYRFQVRGWTSAGNGSFSEAIAATTETGVPDRVTGLQILAINSTQLQVDWLAPNSTPCQIISYTVSYSLVQQGQCDPPEQAETMNVTCTLPDTMVNLTGLLPDSEYTVEVRAETAAGEGEGLTGTSRTLEGLPGSPTSVVLADRTSDSLNFTWDLPVCTERNGVIIEYQVELRGTGSTGSGSSKVVSETFVLYDSLPACASYFFQVGTVTSVGLGSYSEMIEATTESATPDTVTQLQVAFDQTIINVTWQPPADRPCDIIGYNLTYQLIKHLACDGDEDSSEVEITTPDTFYTIIGFLPYSKYLVSVAALTSAGAGNLTSEFVNTSEDVPAPPVLVNTTLTTSSSLEFEWQLPACRDHNGIIQGLSYQLTDAISGSMEDGTLEPDVTTVIFKGLTACTVYAFKVRAWTSAGNGSFSTELRSATEGEVPNAVTNFGIEPSATSLELTWMEPDNITCDITGYSISYKLIRHLQCPEDETDSPLMNVNENPLHTNHTIEGLSPASKYVVSVWAETVDGFGDGNSLEVETLESTPAAPTTISTVNKTARSLTFTWEPLACNESNGAILMYDFELVDTNRSEIVDTGNAPPDITAVTYKGLSPCTEYHFRVRANTSAGFGEFSEATYDVTEGEAPAAVNDFQVIPMSDSAKVTWMSPANQSCEIRGYLITYRLLQHLQCAEVDRNSTEFNITQDSSSREHTIEGLSPASKYSVTVRAQNEYGLGEAVSMEMETEESKPGLPVSINNTEITSRSLAFMWEPPTCSERNGAILLYIYKLVVTEGRELVDERDTLPNVTTAVFEQLLPCTKYHFKVRAETSAGLGRFTAATYATTLGEVPEEVADFQVSPTSSSIHVTWTPPVNQTCEITSYLITYRLVQHLQCAEADRNSTEFNVTQNSTSREYTIEGLSPASKYLVTVRAQNEYGLGNPVSMDTETEEAAPGLVMDLSADHVGQISANFSWLPPPCEDSHGNITVYDYFIQSAEKGMMGGTVDTFQSVSDLKPCTVYNFSVKASTSAGSGDYSQPVSFQTLTAVPGKIDEPMSREKNSTYAEITWSSPVSTDNPCPIQQYTVHYYLKKLKGCQPSPSDTFTVMTNDTWLSLENLRPFAIYKISVTASTSAGDGETSDEYRLETDTDVPDQIMDVRLTNTSMDFLQFSWSELECSARHDKIEDYEYQFTSIEDDEEGNSGIIQEEGGEYVAIFNSLRSCTEYEFRVRAEGAEFPGVWSDWVKGVTSTTVPEEVENLTLLPGDDPATEIQVSWQASMLDDCPVGIYQVAYRAKSLEDCDTDIGTFNWTYVKVNNFSIVLRNLQPFSLYTVTVRGETTAGLGKEVSATLQTSEDVPSGPPQDIATNLTGPNDIHFIWQPPACGERNGVITNYTYTLYKNSTSEVTAGGVVTTTGVLVSDLVPYVVYRFSVGANTAAGPGPPDFLTVETEEGEPPAPRNLHVVDPKTFSLELEWNRPDPPSGVISAYQILYWHHGLDENSAVSEEFLPDPSNPVLRYVITELQPYTEYDIKVRARTGAGFGDWTQTITNRTAEGAPEEPVNVDVTDRSVDTITIGWEKPLLLNGILSGYRVEYKIIDQPFGASSSNDVARSSGYKIIQISPLVPSHTLQGLDAATGYEIRIAAQTVKTGEFVTLPSVYTRIPPIEKPEMVAPPSLSDDNVITLQLREIPSPYISVYQVTVTRISAVSKRDTSSIVQSNYKQSPDNYIAAEFDKANLPQTFKVGDNKTYGGYYNAPLKAGTNYNIQFCGVGKTNQDTEPSCSEPSSVTTHSINTSMGMILGAIVAVLALVAVVLIAIIIIRKRRRSTKSDHITNGVSLTNLEKAESRSNGLRSQAVVEEMVRSELRRSGGVKGQSTTPAPQPTKVGAPPKKAWKPHKPVSLQDLPEYVKKKKANGNKGFTRDYASLPDELLYPINASQKDVNKTKNRYANIVPYDHSRVVLDPRDGEPDTDYINASFIDGYKQKNAYIATQGHNKCSTPDFWRMVWQQEVAIIVMLTNLVENGKKKCLKYWQDDQQNYDDIVVKLVSERVEHDFTLRVFVIANINIEEDMPREVKQFHYTSWPDMGLPDSPAPLMNFIHEVKQIEEDNTGPMVVHCSAGVGRTGTFITVDAMLNMVAEEKIINVIDFVHEMRKKRMKMVQTPEQYMFIFEVLLETLLCGDTVMNANTFHTQYAALHDRNPLTGNSYVEEHFRVLDTMSVAPSDDNCHGGRNEMNLDKNRFHDCIPLDKSRPYLMSPGDDEDSTNYINASFIDAYKKKDGFLATQSPLPNTVVDFWRMVYDYNARVIIMLNEIDGSDESCAPYWLDDPEEVGLFGIFEVQLRDCKSFSHTVARTFKLKNTSKASEKPRTIHHFEFKEWSDEEELPSSIIPFLGFMELVEQGHQQTGGDGRIAVHCLDGVSRSGVFCAAMASLGKLKEEKIVDVFHAVRNLRRNRDVMVESPDQYLFCYEVLKTYLEENETYANFR